jgi:hypothetical protein
MLIASSHSSAPMAASPHLSSAIFSKVVAATGLILVGEVLVAGLEGIHGFLPALELELAEALAVVDGTEARAEQLQGVLAKALDGKGIECESLLPFFLLHRERSPYRRWCRGSSSCWAAEVRRWSTRGMAQADKRPGIMIAWIHGFRMVDQGFERGKMIAGEITGFSSGNQAERICRRQ